MGASEPAEGSWDAKWLSEGVHVVWSDEVRRYIGAVMTPVAHVGDQGIFVARTVQKMDQLIAEYCTNKVPGAKPTATSKTKISNPTYFVQSASPNARFIYEVEVWAERDDQEDALVGRVKVQAPRWRDARHLAISAVWDSRLDAAGCRPWTKKIRRSGV